MHVRASKTAGGGDAGRRSSPAAKKSGKGGAKGGAGAGAGGVGTVTEGMSPKDENRLAKRFRDAQAKHRASKHKNIAAAADDSEWGMSRDRWNKRHGLEDGAKVFILTGNFRDMLFSNVSRITLRSSGLQTYVASLACCPLPGDVHLGR